MFAIADVRVGVIVIRDAFFLTKKARLHECHLRQCARSAVRKELSDWSADVEILCSPKGQQWEVAEIITAVEAVIGQSIPDCGQIRKRQNRIVETIGLG